MDTILVVDDEVDVTKMISDFLVAKGYNVLAANTGARALELLDAGGVDLISLDIRLPDMSGVELLEEARRRCSNAKVIVFTGYPAHQDSFACARLGADEYLDKKEGIPALVSHVDKLMKGGKGMRRPGHMEDASLGRIWMTGSSPTMRKLRQDMGLAAGIDDHVLIACGCTAAQEHVARSIHAASSRYGGPFVFLDCSTLDEETAEEEIFGRRRRGAGRAGKGCFERARGGVLFMCEVHALPKQVQSRLLSAAARGVYRPLGVKEEKRADVRIMSATTKSAAAFDSEGGLLDELRCLLESFVIRIPPLKDRREDIPALARKLLDEACTRYGVRAQGFSPDAMHLLVVHPWKTDVLELKNAVNAAARNADGTHVTPSHLPASLVDAALRADDGLSPEEKRKRKELEETRRAYEDSGRRVLKTAEKLNVSRATVWRRRREMKRK